MRSLFVLSLPRSLSTEVHGFCCAALGLANPAWTTAGEIMNLDRFAMNGGRFAASPKYIQARHGAIFDGATQFLDHCHVETGFCYKDVTQPFVVSAWLNRHPAMAVLKIVPNVAHTAYAMMRRRWLYPTVASDQRGDEATMMMEGLLRAEAALAGVPGETIGFDDLLMDRSGLDAVLARHAGPEAMTPFSLPEDFERRRDEVLARRSLDAFKALEELESRMRARRRERGVAMGSADTGARRRTGLIAAGPGMCEPRCADAAVLAT